MSDRSLARSTPASRAPHETAVRRPGSSEPLSGRIPAMLACAFGFGGYLILVAFFALPHLTPGTEIVALVVGAAVMGWYTTATGAAGVGVLGWLFYSGFVEHANGQLGITSGTDAVVAVALIGSAVSSAGTHHLLARGARARLDRRIPRQRSAS